VVCKWFDKCEFSDKAFYKCSNDREAVRHCMIYSYYEIHCKGEK